ncbi:hypothetical protein [Parasitella parasitica]|uniref:Endonuclease/exonuclease/phosphatase domain-containing protein n=1 Tax=Parasitella parasitica TaxID=35722 RepID=A0A0B7NCX0_9FUNG|nr:hypothetical protein [Parasitella parasitica]
MCFRRLRLAQLFWAPAQWLQYLNDYFIDGITALGATPASTFLRGLSESCIDYVFLSSDFSSSVQYEHCSTSYVQPAWSDHSLLSCQLRLYPSPDASSTSAVVSRHSRGLLVCCTEMGTAETDDSSYCQVLRATPIIHLVAGRRSSSHKKHSGLSRKLLGWVSCSCSSKELDWTEIESDTLG